MSQDRRCARPADGDPPQRICWSIAQYFWGR